MFDFRESAINQIMSLYDPQEGDRYRKLRKSVINERIERKRQELLALDSENLFYRLLECVRDAGYSDGKEAEYMNSSEY